MIGVLALLGSAAGRVAAQEPSGLEAAVALEKALVGAIAQAEKSVVAIARVRKQRAEDAPALEFRPDPFGRRVIPSAPPQPTDPDFVPNEYGTGVAVDARGLILTAYHLLGEDSDYYVTTPQRKVYRAWVKAADPRSDLAVLAIDAHDLAPIAMGEAATLKKGQIVILLGNPHAIARDGQASAGWGIVANLARKAPPSSDPSDPTGKRTLHHFGTLIQTDAKLYVGTSGGPLLNLQGQMVGLCVALPAALGYETAASYAIPVDATFRRAVETLKQGREVEYGFLGVQPINLRAEEVLAGVHGMRVDRVVPGTPAARCGLRPDDVITAVDGRPIHEADALVLQVGKLPVEQLVRLSVLREGRPRTIEVVLGKYPVRGKKIVSNPPPGWRGMRIDYPTALADETRVRGMSFTDEAVIVTEVEERSPAWLAKLRRGMLITHVDRTAVRTPKEFRTAVAAKTGPVQLRIAGSEPSHTLTVPDRS